MLKQPSSSRWEMLFDLAVDAILVLAQPGYTIVEANQEACRLTGFSAAELKGKRIEALFSPEVLAKTPLDAGLLDQGQVIRRSRTMTRKDGSVVPIEMQTKRMPDGSYQTIVRDMTEYSRMVEELRRSEEKFCKAFKTSPDAISITRVSDGTYLEINEGFTNMTGYLPEDVVGRSSLPGELGIWVDNDGRQRMLAELERSGFVRGQEAEFRKKNGDVILGMMSARRIDIQGVECLLTITRDITDRKRNEEVLRNNQKLEALGALAGGIAHDFNNLLTGIFGYVASAREDLPPEHPSREDLDKALGVFDRAKALSYQLLTFARGGAPVKKVIELPEVLREAAQLALSGSNVKAEIVTQDGLWACEADSHQIGQVVSNLLLNARHAMPQGGVVSVTASNVEPDTEVPPPLARGRWVKVSVVDKGTGIPAELLPRVFDPFVTTKGQGNGLGLATAFSILKRHDGQIFAESKPGEGSRFTFYLPAACVPGPAQENSPLAPQTAPGRILVLDDEAFIRDIASRLLQSHGCRVSVASSSPEAVALYQAALAEGDPFDAALLDLTIPGEEGGRQALERIRQLDPLVQAVASSGYSDDPVMADPCRYGFVGSLAKPYQKAEFRAMLSKLPRRLPEPPTQ